MKGGLVWACFLAVAFVGAVFGAAAPGTSTISLTSGSHASDVFWVNNTIGFLLSTFAVSGAHELWRTGDSGMSWTRQSLPGTTCYVVRIYQDSISDNLIFLGPPEASCGWNTMNAGLTYTPITIPQLQYISFSPISGWALGRTYDSKVYFTDDLGLNWNIIENATRATWVLPADQTTGDGLHLLSMYMILNGVFGYTLDQGRTFYSLYDDPNMIELHTTSNFVYATAQNHVLLVGSNYKQIQSAYFPFGSQAPNVFTVSDDVSGATWFFTDSSYYWGNIYTTGSNGALYVQSLLHVLKREDAFLDFHNVDGLPGVHIANVVVNFNDYHDLLLKTYITFDNGGSWSVIPSPSAACAVYCSLNLYFNYKSGQRPFYTSKHTIGMLIANGYVAPALSYDHPLFLSPYISRDAGLSWTAIPVSAPGPYLFEVGSNGGILLMAQENVQTNTIYYSLDEGATVKSFTLDASLYILKIFTPAGGASLKFGLFAIDDAGNGFVYGIDFSGFNPRTCVDPADYETFQPSDELGKVINCWLGQTVTYSRRAPAAACTDTRGEQQVSATTCACAREDYECDFGYVVNDNGQCYVASTLPPSPPSVCTSTYEKSQGYRLVPGDKCTITDGSGLDLRPQTLQCPTTTKTTSGSRAWVAIVVVLVVVAVLGLIAFIIFRDPVLKGKVMSFFGISRDSSARYGRVGRANSHSLAHEEDFGIQDDLLADEDAKVLHDHDISKEASHKSKNDG